MKVEIDLTMDTHSAYHYLALARQSFSQKKIAEHLGVDVRTVRRWEAREVEPNPYQIGPALRQLILPLGIPKSHDKAFDLGLICVADDFTLQISPKLKRLDDAFLSSSILKYEGQRLRTPEKFLPHPEFLTFHRDTVFVST